MVRGRWRVGLAVPVVSGLGPMPERQPPVPVLPGILAPVVNAGEVNRALQLLPVHGPKPQVLTGIVTNDDEVPVVLQQQNAQKEEDVEAPKESEKDAQKEEDVEAQEEPKKSDARSLPVGTRLLSVAGVELPGSAVGPALEFMEFCAAFYEPLEMKEEEALMTLREIVRGCKLGKGWGSQVARVHTRLLNVILEDSDERVSPRPKSKHSWLRVLGSYMIRKARTLVNGTILPLSTSPASSHPAFSRSVNSRLKYATTLESGADGYLSLSIDEKLQLLNTLCNDTLNTALLREHIEKGLEDEERKEEEAKKRKKQVKDGELEASSSAPKTEKKTVPSVRTRSAYVGLPESSDSSKLGNTKTRRSAVKTEAIVWDNGSHALWNLKGGDDRRAVISQDISNIGGIPREEWTVYSEEDKEALTVYLDQKKNKKSARKPYHRKASEPGHPVPSMDVAMSHITATDLDSGIKDESSIS